MKVSKSVDDGEEVGSVTHCYDSTREDLITRLALAHHTIQFQGLYGSH